MVDSGRHQRTVLLLTYFFRPDASIGAARPSGLAKYLGEFGWNVVVVTRGDNPTGAEEPATNVLVERVPTRSRVSDLKYALDVGGHKLAQLREDANPGTRLGLAARRAVSEVAALYPDSLPWLRRARRAALAICHTHTVDAVLSTSKPEVAHLVAKSVVQHFGVPWLADFRDPWTTNYAYVYAPIRRVPERLLERRVIAPADAITTVSDGFATLLRQAHPNKPIEVIANGFDPDLLAPTGVPLDRKLTVVYTGKLYRKQQIEPLFEALRRLGDTGRIDLSRIQLCVYGEPTQRLKALAERFHLTASVEQRGVISREDAVAAQRRAQVLLLPRWNGGAASGVIAGKLFEYLAARRPILAPGTGEDETAAVIRTVGAGSATSTVAETEAFLLRAYDEFVSNGSVSYGGHTDALEQFSQRVMAGRFATQLDHLAERRRGASGR
jgi:glycosyltransferase involved in cell wall biosynthesis